MIPGCSTMNSRFEPSPALPPCITKRRTSEIQSWFLPPHYRDESLGDVPTSTLALLLRPANP